MKTTLDLPKELERQAEEHEAKAQYHKREALKLRKAINIMTGTAQKKRPKSQFYSNTLPARIFDVLNKKSGLTVEQISQRLIKDEPIAKNKMEAFDTHLKRTLRRLTTDEKLILEGNKYSIAGKIEPGH